MDTDDFIIFGNDDVDVSEDIFQGVYNAEDIGDMNDPNFAGLMNMSSSNQYQQVSSVQHNNLINTINNSNMDNLRQQQQHIQQLQQLQSHNSSNQSNNIDNSNSDLSWQHQGVSSYPQNFFHDHNISNATTTVNANTTNTNFNAEEQKKTIADKKRQDRNAREQQRSLKISRQIDALRQLLKESGVSVKNSKSSVLEGVAAYLTSLQEKIDIYGEGDNDVILNQDQIYPGNFNVGTNMNVDGDIYSSNEALSTMQYGPTMNENANSSNLNDEKSKKSSSSSSSSKEGFSNSTYRSILLNLPIPLALLLIDGSLILHNNSMNRIMQCAPAIYGDGERHAIQSVYDMTPVDHRDELRQKLMKLVGTKRDTLGCNGTGVHEWNTSTSASSSKLLQRENNQSNIASNTRTRRSSERGSKVTLVKVDYGKEEDAPISDRARVRVGVSDTGNAEHNKTGNERTEQHQSPAKEPKRISTRSSQRQDVTTTLASTSNKMTPIAIVSDPNRTDSDDLNDALNFAIASMNQEIYLTNSANIAERFQGNRGQHLIQSGLQRQEEEAKRRQEKSEAQHFYHPSVYYWEGEQLFLAVSVVNEERTMNESTSDSTAKENLDVKYLNLALVHENECI